MSKKKKLNKRLLKLSAKSKEVYMKALPYFKAVSRFRLPHRYNLLATQMILRPSENILRFLKQFSQLTSIWSISKIPKNKVYLKSLLTWTIQQHLNFIFNCTTITNFSNKFPNHVPIHLQDIKILERAKYLTMY